MSARGRLVVYGALTVAGCWVGAGALLIAGWCLVCHRTELDEVANT